MGHRGPVALWVAAVLQMREFCECLKKGGAHGYYNLVFDAITFVHSMWCVHCVLCFYFCSFQCLMTKACNKTLKEHQYDAWPVFCWTCAITKLHYKVLTCRGQQILQFMHWVFSKHLPTVGPFSENMSGSESKGLCGPVIGELIPELASAFPTPVGGKEFDLSFCNSTL